MIVTPENKTRLVNVMALKMGSGEINDAGTMATMQTITPITQAILISCEDRVRIIRRIRGILNSGIETEATKAIFCMTVIGRNGTSRYELSQVLYSLTKVKLETCDM